MIPVKENRCTYI